MGRCLSTDKSMLTGGIVIGNAKYPAGYGDLRMAQAEMEDVVFFVPGTVLYEGEAAIRDRAEGRARGGPRLDPPYNHLQLRSNQAPTRTRSYCSPPGAVTMET